MKFFSGLVSVALLASCSAYSPASIHRREVFHSLVAAAGASTAVIVNPSLANAVLESCPKGNCIRTEWTPPPGMNKEAAIASLRKALESYPQEGQNSVDLGGWTIVDDFADGSGRVEFKSGIGNFAKFFNGGKPFIDDLRFEIDDSGVVSVRSSSRVGDSDLGVNQKRLYFLVTKLREAGWSAPTPTY